MLVPSTVTGPVVPACGMGRTKIGTPLRQSFRPASVISASCCSGATVQLVTEKSGRCLSDAPATAS